MSADITSKITDRMAQYALDLAEQRDEHIAHARRSLSDSSREYHVGSAAAMRLALAWLHIATDGEHGAPSGEQPSPFEVPIGSGSMPKEES
jgi:hypothetical protein